MMALSEYQQLLADAGPQRDWGALQAPAYLAERFASGASIGISDWLLRRIGHDPIEADEVSGITRLLGAGAEIGGVFMPWGVGARVATAAGRGVHWALKGGKVTMKAIKAGEAAAKLGLAGRAVTGSGSALAWMMAERGVRGEQVTASDFGIAAALGAAPAFVGAGVKKFATKMQTRGLKKFGAKLSAPEVAEKIRTTSPGTATGILRTWTIGRMSEQLQRGVSPMTSRADILAPLDAKLRSTIAAITTMRGTGADPAHLRRFARKLETLGRWRKEIARTVDTFNWSKSAEGFISNVADGTFDPGSMLSVARHSAGMSLNIFQSNAFAKTVLKPTIDAAAKSKGITPKQWSDAWMKLHESEAASFREAPALIEKMMKAQIRKPVTDAMTRMVSFLDGAGYSKKVSGPLARAFAKRLDKLEALAFTGQPAKFRKAVAKEMASIGKIVDSKLFPKGGRYASKEAIAGVKRNMQGALVKFSKTITDPKFPAQRAERIKVLNDGYLRKIHERMTNEYGTEMVQFDKAWTNMMNSLRQKGLDAGMEIGFINQYIHHAVEGKPGAKKKWKSGFASSKMRPGLSRQRRADTIDDVAASLEKWNAKAPKGDQLQVVRDPVRIMDIYAKSLSESVATNSILRELKSRGLIRKRPGPPVGKKHWQTFKDSSVQEVVGGFTGYIHPSVWPDVRNFMMRKYQIWQGMSEGSQRFFEGWRKVNSAIAQMKMINPLIHGTNLLSDVFDEFHFRMSDVIKKSAEAKGFLAAKYPGNPKVTDAIASGLSGVSGRDILGQVAQADKVLGTAPKHLGILANAMHWIGKGGKWSRQTTFKTLAEPWLHAMYGQKLNELIRETPGKMTSQIMGSLKRTAAAYANINLGMLKPEYLEPHLRSSMGLLFFARNWTLSNMSMGILGASSLAGKGAMGVMHVPGVGQFEKLLLGRHFADHIARGFTWLYSAANMMQYSMTGTWAFQNPGGWKRKMSVWTGTQDYKGRDEYLVLPFFRYLNDIVGWPTSAGETLRNKMAPALRGAMEVLFNRNLRTGEAISRSRVKLTDMPQSADALGKNAKYLMEAMTPFMDLGNMVGIGNDKLSGLEKLARGMGSYMRHGMRGGTMATGAMEILRQQSWKWSNVQDKLLRLHSEGDREEYIRYGVKEKFFKSADSGARSWGLREQPLLYILQHRAKPAERAKLYADMERLYGFTKEDVFHELVDEGVAEKNAYKAVFGAEPGTSFRVIPQIPMLNERYK